MTLTLQEQIDTLEALKAGLNADKTLALSPLAASQVQASLQRLAKIEELLEMKFPDHRHDTEYLLLQTDPLDSAMTVGVYYNYNYESVDGEEFMPDRLIPTESLWEAIDLCNPAQP